MRPSLTGARVLVTRPREGSLELIAGLEALGARVVVISAIAIVAPEDPAPLRAALARLETYSWGVFTSANAVRAVAREVAAWPATLRLAAVGEATANALRSLGRSVEVVGGRDAAELARVLLEGADLQGGKVLFPRGNRASTALSEALRAAGVAVDDPIAYRTVSGFTAAGRSELRDLLGAAELDWIVLGSPSSWEEVIAAIPEPALLRGVRLASIGPTTTQAIRSTGFEVAVEADPVGVAGLLGAFRA